LEFREEPQISNEAKDLISRLLCDVDQRLGSRGVDEIKASNFGEKIARSTSFRRRASRNDKEPRA